MEYVNPNDEFFKKFLKEYYIITADAQYLFASLQKGQRSDRVFMWFYQITDLVRDRDVERDGFEHIALKNYP